MFKKLKKNPVFELQKKLLDQKIIMGFLEDDGKLETDDKIMYTITEIIYNEAAKEEKKNDTKIKFIFAALGLVAGIFFAMLLQFILNFKVK